MHPDQDAEHPWLADEAAFIREAVDREVPLFGVCLGAQLIARAVGAQRRPGAAAEVGWHAVDLNEAGRADPVLGVLPRAARRVPVALLRLRAPRRRRAPRRQRRRAPGLPARRAHVGRPVPPRGDAAHARPLVRRGRGGAAGPGRASRGKPTRISAPGTSTGGGSAAPSSTRRRRLSALLLDRQLWARPTTRATSRRSCAPRSRRPQQLDGHRRADAGVAVRDHLCALGRADERPDRGRVGGLEQRCTRRGARPGRWPWRASHG